MRAETWSPTVTLSFADKQVMIDDPASMQRLAVDPAIFASFLAGGSSATDSRIRASLEARRVLGGSLLDADPMAANWVAQGWASSLRYFLWSEGVRYVDWDDQDDSGRNRAMAELVRAEPAPRRFLPDPDVPFVALPNPGLAPPERMLGETLLGRRTTRVFANAPLSCESLSSVLWSGFETVRASRERATNEASGLLETFGVGIDVMLIAYSVDGVEPGAWDLDVLGHRLHLRHAADLRESMVDIMCGMSAARSAAATLIFVADFDQWRFRYRHERALRDLYIEVGRIAQNVIVAAEIFDLGCLITPATNDAVLSTLLGVDGLRRAPLYTVTLGVKQSAPRRRS